MEYSVEFKQAMVQKMLEPPGRSASSLSQDVGVSKSTLASWRNMAVAMGHKKDTRTAKHQRGNERSGEEKLRILMQVEVLKEEELGGFLRKEGVYEAQLENWRKELVNGLSGDESKKELRAQLKAERAKNKILERELHRKEKALAEAAALLILKKKVEEYFGVAEDEYTAQKKS